jgi:type I restriction enzyme S subunit
MAPNWPYMRVEDIAEKVAMGPFGSSIKVETFTPTGIPIISGQHLHEAELEDGDNKFISTEHADALKNANVRKGDVIFTHAGNIGQVAFIPEDSVYDRYVISQRQFYLRCNTKLILPEFVTYYFKSPEGRHKLLANATQVGVPSIARPSSYLKSIEVPVPPLDEQLIVVRNIRTIEAKIRINRRINQTLEAMAQAIFKSWFVDFDPVKAKITAKAEGRDPLRAAMTAISGKTDAELDTLPPDQFTPLAATAALFPDEMEDSELGEIPQGWKVCPLPECVDINPTRVLKKGAIAPYLDMANVPTNAARVDNVIVRAFGSGSKFINGDTLLARITPCLENGKTAYVDFLADGEVGSGSTEFIVLRPKNGLPLPFAYFLCRHPEFRAFAISQMAGTSGRQRVPNDCFGAYKVVKPSLLIADAFGLQTTQFMKQIKSLDEESKTLAGLRDALLPRLLSGELQIQNTESEVEA